MKTLSNSELVNQEISRVEAELQASLGPERARALNMVGGGVLELIALKLLVPIVVGFAKDVAIDTYKSWKSRGDLDTALSSVGGEPAVKQVSPDKDALQRTLEETLSGEGIPADVATRVVRSTIERVESRLGESL